MFNRFTKTVLIVIVFIGSFLFLFKPAPVYAAAAIINNFDLNPKTVANTSQFQAQFQMTLRVTINVGEFNAVCGSNVNSFSWQVNWDVSGQPDIKKQGGSQTINRTGPTLSYNLDESIIVNLDPSEFTGGSSNYYAAIYCPGTLGSKLTDSQRVRITFGSVTDKRYACIAGNNKYACSQANLTNCSDVSDCSRGACRQIGANLCGQDAGTNKYSCNSNRQCVASATGTYTDPNCENKCTTGGAACGNGRCESGETQASCPADCKPGEDQSFDFIIDNPLKGGADDLGGLVKVLAQWLFNLAIPIAVIMIIYAGVLFLTAQGNPTTITKAKDVLKYAVIGLAIILIGNGFVTLIQSILKLGAPPPVEGPLEPPGPAPLPVPVPGAGAVGNYCGNKDSNCLTGLKCKNTICQRPTGNWAGEPCVAGASCDIGLSCDKSGSAIQPIDGQTLGTCFVNSVPGGRIGDLCEKDSNCLSGFKCNKICQRKGGNLNGETCLKTADNCKSNACRTIGAEVRGDCVEYSGT